MADSSKIEWTDATWNPVTGCAKVSPGCAHCYAERVALRLWKTQYPPIGEHEAGCLGEIPGIHCVCSNPPRPREFTDVMCHEGRLDQPLRWKCSRKVFVNSMSDLFHEDVPDQFITDVFGIMALAHWHVFQVLTKRPQRMLDYLSRGDHGIVAQFEAMQRCGGISTKPVFAALDAKRRDRVQWQWPLPNVWLGVSVENQHFADERIPLLLQTPAAVRFISYEPALGRVDLTNLLGENGDALNLPGLDWVIVGGESGPGARQLDVAWARSIVAQCKASGVPVFVKQLGARPYDIARPKSVTDAERAQWMRDGWTRVITDEGECFTNHPRVRDRKGGDMSEWPEDLRVREYPDARGGPVGLTTPRGVSQEADHSDL